MLAHCPTPKPCRALLRIFQQTWLPFLGYADFEIPAESWWKEMRLRLGVASKVLSAMEIGAVKDITQMGWDESEIERRNTLSVWVRIAKAGAEAGGEAGDEAEQYKTIFLKAAAPQVGATSPEVAEGVADAFKEVSHGRAGRAGRRS